MADQQLVDYIKKAREAGQKDDQTRILLYKNGWEETEVDDAIKELSKSSSQENNNIQTEEVKPQIQPKIENQPQIINQIEPEIINNTQPIIQAEPEIQKPEPQKIDQTRYQPQTNYSPQFNRRSPFILKHFLFSFLKIILILVILISIIGIGYSTVGQYFNLPYSDFVLRIFTPNPQVVIDKMVVNMKDIRSYHTITKLEINAIENAKSQGKLSLDTNIETDITDSKNIKLAGNFIFNLSLPIFSKEETEAPKISATISLLSIDKTNYIKINELIIPEAYNLEIPDISKIKGVWLKLDNDSIKALSKNSEQEILMPDISQLNTSDFTKKIQDIILTEKMFSVNKQLGSEKINGQDTYHYLLTIKKDKIKILINKLIESELNKASGVQDQGLLVINMIQAMTGTIIDSIGDIDLDVWIGKKDYMLYQININKSIDLNKISKAIMGEYGSVTDNNSRQIDFKYIITNSNFNKEIKFEVPVSTQKIEDVLLPMIQTENIKKDLDRIGSNAKMLYFINKSYSSLCYKGLLNGNNKSYGASLMNLNKDIISQGGKRPSCFASTKDYCVSTQLSNGTYLCIDKNEKIGNTKCLSAKTKCLSIESSSNNINK